MQINKKTLSEKIYDYSNITIEEVLFIYNNFSLPELINIANSIRKQKHPDNVVTYIIDRNINITNVCFSFCDFCNFCRTADDDSSYITSNSEYKLKIEKLYSNGGNQLLLQGGMHPEFGLDFYTTLFRNLKKMFPAIYLHALSPPEIIFLSKKESMPIATILEKLLQAGLDSLPGGGAEILCDRVRKIISPLKATTKEWIEVMKTAHQLNILTTATMMFGHIETIKERLEHILLLRDTQSQKPEKSIGFISFIPWSFQHKSTRLAEKFPKNYGISTHEYVKTIAISRILLNNIDNIQASWLTAGNEAAMLALHSGANDLGSIMLEENVVASAGVCRKMTKNEMLKLIEESGFIPLQRNQFFANSFTQRPQRILQRPLRIQ